MQKWEYAFLFQRKRNQIHVSMADGKKESHKGVTLMEAIAFMGNDGWEAVNYISGVPTVSSGGIENWLYGDAHREVLFKRPLAE